MKHTFTVLFLSLLPALAIAQTDSGTIRVLVSDGSASTVSEAVVKLTNVATGVVTSRTTGEEGYAIFSPIVRGSYVAEVSKPGFQPTRVTDLRLDVDERKLVRVTMQLASVNETVEVSAASDIVQSEQAALGQVIRGAVAVELPLAARRYTDLALLVPGATESTVLTTTRGPGWFVVNGNYQAQNNYIIDGVDNNQGTTNAQALSAQVVQPSPDAISEFKVQTNGYSAEFGRSAGAAINVVIKSGTNQPHGSAWYYNRDTSLAATPWSNNLIGAGNPKLKWHQYGGTFGGPAIKTSCSTSPTTKASSGASKTPSWLPCRRRRKRPVFSIAPSPIPIPGCRCRTIPFRLRCSIRSARSWSTCIRKRTRPAPWPPAVKRRTISASRAPAPKTPTRAI